MIAVYMTIEEICTAIGIKKSQFGAYRRQGVFPELPTGYKKTPINEMFPYINECVYELGLSRKRGFKRRTGRRAKKDWSLPGFLERAERKLTT